MASTATDPAAKSAMLQDFHSHLLKSRRTVALLGAGLSASSGLPTFRGAGGLWRTHDATSLATPQAFAADPAFVWQFYSYRRHMALNAKPNPAHYALAQLAKNNPHFLTLSQNVDGLSPRANHPPSQLKLLHGNLFDLKCTDKTCGYTEPNNFTDPITPALAIPQSGQDPTATPNTNTNTPTNPLIKGLDISNANHTLPTITQSSLPHCPQCKKSLLRPGVVWFGEALPTSVMSDVDAFFSSKEPIDLMLVIGTSSAVYPAAGYTQFARHKGARVAVVNPDPSSGDNLDGKKDWFFCEDAAKILPEMLRPVIGDVGEVMEQTGDAAKQ
ncbi:hypothetical protein PMZ80_000115 [Knufia obscura]|uniref:Deacetylase sirtuin-type domain-containing protein n=2 Tax=Knufia TaxID=430999 RepID=A0AAN8EIY6_9EURO|nr:hypothetical protein PMZ80_000115 [Knufia obscura]KAK5956954.1 hypothetical protein OHC33_002443 [Knufia fluminis]